MGILNLKKKKAAPAAEEAKGTRKAARKPAISPSAKGALPAVAVRKPDHSDIVVRPLVTEKATVLSANGAPVRVFEVSRAATKRTVSEAVRFLYKVSPKKVAILKVPPKKSVARGRISYGKTIRKAYVYLRPGDKIDLA